MKIYLFDAEKLYTFYLPVLKTGLFKFDKNDQEEIKLINIKCENNKWLLYSTENVKVYDDNTYVSECELIVNKFYVLEKEDTKSLIIAMPIYDDTFNKYTYDKKINLTIANDNSSVVTSNLKGKIRVFYENDNLVLEKNDEQYVYINSSRLKNDKAFINNGDTINIYNITISFFANLVFINNPGNQNFINELTANIQKFENATLQEPKDIDIKDRELYKESQYFFKSPRLRRMIETKEVKIQSPPAKQTDEEVPLIYTLGPMVTTGITSSTMLLNVVVRVMNEETTFEKSWAQIVMGGAMLLTTMLWPSLNKAFQKKQKKKKEKERLDKYSKYLEEKREEIKDEFELQKNILIENLIPLNECIEIIEGKKTGIWGRRIDQEDFLTVRLGIGDVPLDIDIDYSTEDFSMEEDVLKEKLNTVVNEYKTIKDVPVSYSFLNKRMTAIMGSYDESTKFMEAIILQLIAFHSYDDLKFVIFTDKENEKRWEPIKNLQHNFDDSKQFRFFASTKEEIKEVTNYLEQVLYYRHFSEKDGSATEIAADYQNTKPYYLIITDNYNLVKRTNLFKELTELEDNYGFSMIILENLLGRLPSKLDNFISLSSKSSTVLESAYESQKQSTFNYELNTNYDIKKYINALANIPIEFIDDTKNLPNSLGFLEMYNVGKVEQLNILNRWKANDPTKTLKAEVGVDANNDLMFLDIHEKYHGPHGLIAGMTGSGKSEFIITYVLSLAVNYSPEEVSFILIDYKGGGLAGAFENKKTGFRLPHLAGVITNLDKSEMNRTLVSIDSEIRRRQAIFNDTRDALNESTIDIYKYQGFYRDGKVKEPLSHLLIICDEFAELKSQQPDFMDNLISVARIGRSLGVHLILATQKPSGIVNDQIWSNSKFRVCLKVQDKSDSMEMLKRPEAAEIKQAGRFYLQVGYNEYFNLGQSAYTGTKYYPSDEIIKTVDKSINFINDVGSVIKSIQSSNNNKNKVAQGEEILNVLKYIIDNAKRKNISAQKLWLDSLSDTLYISGLIGKYNYTFEKSKVNAIIGEFDDPENQKQGILTLDLSNDGNTIIYGNSTDDKEMFINAIIYSTLNYTSEEINYYIVDYGSEQSGMFLKFPQVGDIVFASEDEKLINLLKMLDEIISERKKLLAATGSDYQGYIKQGNKLPLINVIINNYDSFVESHDNLEEDIIKISREGVRYGINLILTAITDTSIRSKIKQNFNNIFALQLNDKSDYNQIFGFTKGKAPKELPGRGLFKDSEIHEFQTALIAEDGELDKTLDDKLAEANKISPNRAISIPTLPDKVDFEFIKNSISTLSSVPIGVGKKSLKVVTYDFKANIGTSVLANSVMNIKKFIKSLVITLSNIKNIQLIIVDAEEILAELKSKIQYFYDKDFDAVLEQLTAYATNFKTQENSINFNCVCLLVGVDKIKNKVDSKKLDEFCKISKSLEKFKLVLVEDYKKMKKFEYDEWYRSISNNTSGIWVGPGLSEQTVFRLVKITKEMQANYENNYGYSIKDTREELVKLIDFDEGDNQDEK